MKIQCNVCEVAEANVLCCADEAALCWACDQKVHSVNNVVSQHQRVPLCSSKNRMPKCDICQETIGYFFCLEDRAILCRKCDIAVHTMNSFVSAHQRFLLTGVKVGLDTAEPGPSPSSWQRQYNRKNGESGLSFPRMTNSTFSSRQHSGNLSAQASGDEVLPPNFPFVGGSASGIISQLDEFLDLDDFGQNDMDNGSSKVNGGKLGDLDCSQILRAADGEAGGDECMGQAAGFLSHPSPNLKLLAPIQAIYSPRELCGNHCKTNFYCE